MNNDFISRQAAIAAIHELKMSVSGYDNDALDVSLIYEVLGEIPAADVQPVKRGHWFLRGGNWCCSYCNKKTLLVLESNVGDCRTYGTAKTEYCPNCGAVMSTDE